MIKWFGVIIVFWMMPSLLLAEGDLNIKKAVIESTASVRIIFENQSDVRIDAGGESGNLKISPDRKAVGWLIYHKYDRGIGLHPYTVSSILRIYRNGESSDIHTHPWTSKTWGGTGVYFWSWHFWKDRDHIAVHAGPTHFSSGYSELYDLSESVEKSIEIHDNDSEKDAPIWSKEQ